MKNRKALSKKGDMKNCTKTDTSGQVENTKVMEELSLRNSAKCLCKLAIRRPEREHKIGIVDCLPKT